MTEARPVTVEQLAAACTNPVTWDAGFHTEEAVRALAAEVWERLPAAAPAEGLREALRAIMARAAREHSLTIFAMAKDALARHESAGKPYAQIDAVSSIDAGEQP
jgi:hypothetical protein